MFTCLVAEGTPDVLSFLFNFDGQLRITLKYFFSTSDLNQIILFKRSFYPILICRSQPSFYIEERNLESESATPDSVRFVTSDEISLSQFLGQFVLPGKKPSALPTAARLPSLLPESIPMPQGTVPSAVGAGGGGCASAPAVSTTPPGHATGLRGSRAATASSLLRDWILLRCGALLRPSAREPGAQGVERAGAAATWQPPHRRGRSPVPPAAPPPRRRAPAAWHRRGRGPAPPPRTLAPRARVAPRPARARALLARCAPGLRRLLSARRSLPRAHSVCRAAGPPCAALRAAAEGRWRRDPRLVPARPLATTVRRRHRRATRPHGRGLLRAPRAQAAPRLWVRDGHRPCRGRGHRQGARVLPARRQR
jgi:hypothetical protein